MPEQPPWRVAFAGTPAFAALALDAMVDAGFSVPLVLSQPDRPAGRGLQLQPSPVKQRALEHGIEVIQPRGLKLDGRFPDDAALAQARLQQVAPDVIVLAAYGLLLPAWTLALAPGGCINIHASLLPRWRGAAPIHRAIQAGDAHTGITLMQMDAGLDTGAVICVQSQAIQADDTTAALTQRLAQCGAELLVQTLQSARSLPLSSEPQPTAGVCYAHKLGKDEAALDWTLPAAALERQVRAFDPAPGSTVLVADQVFKVWQTRVVPAQWVDDPTTAWDSVPGHAPGRVLALPRDGPVVACGNGSSLQLLMLQRPGGRRLPAQQALRAGELSVGQLLST